MNAQVRVNDLIEELFGMRSADPGSEAPRTLHHLHPPPPGTPGDEHAVTAWRQVAWPENVARARLPVGDAHSVLGPVTADAVDDMSDSLSLRVAVGSSEQEQRRSHLHLQP